jgi:hypothetical protein
VTKIQNSYLDPYLTQSLLQVIDQMTLAGSYGTLSYYGAQLPPLPPQRMGSFTMLPQPDNNLDAIDEQRLNLKPVQSPSLAMGLERERMIQIQIISQILIILQGR